MAPSIFEIRNTRFEIQDSRFNIIQVCVRVIDFFKFKIVNFIDLHMMI